MVVSAAKPCKVTPPVVTIELSPPGKLKAPALSVIDFAPTFEAARLRVLASVMATVPLPVAVRVTFPTKSFPVWVRIMSPMPELMVVVPVTVTTNLSLDPVACVIAPSIEVATRFPPTVPAPKLKPYEVTSRFPPIDVVVPKER